MRLRPADIISKLSNPIKQGSNIFADCPFCGKPANRKKFSYAPDKIEKSKYGVFNCFSCGEKGSGYKLHKHLSGSDIRVNESFTLKEEKKTENYLRDGINPQYVYYDPETMKPVFAKYQYSPGAIGRKGKAEKRFYTLGYDAGKWQFEYNGKKFLFNLHNAVNHDIVFIFEGEKKSLYAQRFTDHLCLSYPTGAKYRISETDIQYLKGKIVYIFPDYDDSEHNSIGQVCAAENYAILKAAGIEAYIIDITGRADIRFSGYDFEDFLSDNQGAESDIIKNLIIETDSTTTANFISRYGHKFTAEYISDYLPEMNCRAAFIQSIQGTGKTVSGSAYTKADEKIVYVCSRSALTRENGNKYGIENYTGIAGNLRQSYEGSLSACLNSLSSFPAVINSGNDTVILDEMSLLTDDLFRSNTEGLTGMDRLKAISSLKKLSTNSRRVIGYDSDIRPSTKLFAEKILNIDFSHFINQYSDSRKFTEYNSFESVIESVSSELSAGNKTSVAFSSKRKAKNLIAYLEQKYPDKKCLLITQDTLNFSEVKAALDSNDLMKQYACVIFSPTIFTGNDFNIEFGRKAYIIITDNKTVNHWQIMQGAGRFRQADEIHYFIKQVNGQRETDPQKIRQEKSFPHSEFMAMTPDYEMTPMDDLIEIYAVLESEDRHSKNNLLSNFRNLIISRGSVISKADEIETESVIEELEQSSKISESERIRDTLSADDITKKLADEIETAGAADQAEFYSLQKFKYNEIINNDPSRLEQAVKIRLSTLQTAAGRFRDMNTPIEKLIQRDRDSITGYLPDNKYSAVESRLRNEIESRLKGLSGNSLQGTDDLIAYLEQNRDRIRSILGLEVNPKKAGYFIRGFYQQIGIRLKLVSKNNDIRIYQADQESIDFMRVCLRADQHHNDTNKADVSVVLKTEGAELF